MEIPSDRKQPSVEAQSRAVEKFEISVLPWARAAISAARCEMDLSPGKRNRPLIERAGLSLMMSRLCPLWYTKVQMCYKLLVPADASSLSAGVPPEIVMKQIGRVIPAYDPMSAILYPTVLVAEDSIDTRIMLKRAFELKGYRVFEAEDGQQALDLAKHYRPSLIVIDLNMPVLDGLETIRNLRSLEGDGTHTPIIAITAYDVYGMEEAAFETGCNVYLSKPLNLEELDRAVKSLGFLV